MDKFELYKDMQARTNGEIYIGVVGPVRTGKSTFIKRFMDILVLPNMEDEHERTRTLDELPQSASGKTIMTTEPKFVPQEAAQIRLSDDVSAKVRLIDCVGYMVEGASGYIEGKQERQVKTPWFDYEIPFTKAAGIGTRKVIHDHATIGIVVTTDGSIGEIPRENFVDAEKKTIQELQAIGKPFIVLINSQKPYAKETLQLVEAIEQEYHVHAISVNCEQLKEDDIYRILEAVLFEFPISEIQFYIPKWIEMLPRTHVIKQDMIDHVRVLLNQLNKIRDATQGVKPWDSPYIEECHISEIEMATGTVQIHIKVDEVYYYQVLSEMTGMEISGQYELVSVMKHLVEMKHEYEGVKDAFESVRMKGYGIVSPARDEITMEEPEIIKQGSKYGVKIHSHAPSIHLIKANIETEIAPIVGSEQQAKDLLEYIKSTSDHKNGIRETNIFGKSIEELVMDGMRNKMSMIGEESQTKLQDTMQKIVNDSNGGLVCIII